MIIEIVLAIVGLYLILKGSEWVTDASIPLARHLNTTYVAVGLVLVSVLLSLPELLVSLSATFRGYNGIGVGVILGSIIVNIGLIIGISAIIHPLKIPRHVITRDAVFMVIATIVVSLLALGDMQVSRRDGIILLLLYIPYLINIYEQEKELAITERRKESDRIARTLQFIGKVGGAEIVVHNPIWIFIGGMLMLLVGSELFTNVLIMLANNFAIPELLIGLTLGALGPSIPNLAAALQAVKREYDELAVSETIGSNIFTLMITLGIVAIANPLTIDNTTAIVTAPALLIVTLVFFGFVLTGRVSRRAGLVLFILYILTIVAEIMFR
ncbi:Sodium/calcium exchanger MaX1 [Candidatus Bilamarchaeum dharawalense]|uniref:Sodium/calcium exchanger MaX1 n=1 Tax=Candidatus Bilamarchaeum dharawalense TaxID=2885759 RepID=A0A5E4LM13_9ARCH|nr:Sodium/calcium exchanger MaX1 [Candidatus Bilamarchaeum dharawalense]